MRLFLAIRLMPSVMESLELALVGAREQHPGLRWIPSDRWHLTLVFFGEVAPRELVRVNRRVTRRLGAASALELRLAGAGRFGDRVLWIGVAGDRSQLVALGERLAIDDRVYRPHLTVARGRPGADLRPAVQHLQSYEGPSWTATEIELIESRLGPRPTYETIATWSLNGADPPQPGPADRGRGETP